MSGRGHGPRAATRKPVRRRTARGLSPAVELAVLLPGLLLLLGLIVAGARIWGVRSAVAQAAYAGARAASLERSAAQAGATGRAAVRAELERRGARCMTLVIGVDTAGFAVPVGTPATVALRLVCRVDLSDVAVPGLPGALTITGAATSALDTYRER